MSECTCMLHRLSRQPSSTSPSRISPINSTIILFIMQSYNFAYVFIIRFPQHKPGKVLFVSSVCFLLVDGLACNQQFFFFFFFFFGNGSVVCTHSYVLLACQRRAVPTHIDVDQELPVEQRRAAARELRERDARQCLSMLQRQGAGDGDRRHGARKTEQYNDHHSPCRAKSMISNTFFFYCSSGTRYSLGLARPNAPRRARSPSPRASPRARRPAAHNALASASLDNKGSSRRPPRAARAHPTTQQITAFSTRPFSCHSTSRLVRVVTAFFRTTNGERARPGSQSFVVEVGDGGRPFLIPCETTRIDISSTHRY